MIAAEAMTSKGFLQLILLNCMLLWLAACSNSGSQPLPFKAPANVDATPPQMAASASPAVIQATSLPVTPTPSCTDALVFVADVTLPDGSVVAPGERLDKRWLVKNSGTCNWTEAYTLKLVSGLPLDDVTTQALYPARGGNEAVIRMVFVAPVDPGTYRSAWQAYNPQAQAFGDPFFMEIVVQQP